MKLFGLLVLLTLLYAFGAHWNRVTWHRRANEPYPAHEARQDLLADVAIGVALSVVSVVIAYGSWAFEV